MNITEKFINKITSSEYSIPEIAKMAGMSKQALYKIIKGETKVISSKTLEAICSALGLSLNDLDDTRIEKNNSVTIRGRNGETTTYELSETDLILAKQLLEKFNKK